MKTIGFIGAYDKTDLMLYVARILAVMDKKVLMIDASTLQKAKYMVPTISNEQAYVTNFENVDIAVGFHNYTAIKAYLGYPEHANLTYDYILIDIDSPEDMERFDIKTANKNYFVSGFDLYSIKRGLEIIAGQTEPIPLTKVLFSRYNTKEEDAYLNHMTLGAKAIWNEEKIYFPFEQGDQTIIIDNQRISRVKLKGLSPLYKESLLYIVGELLGDEQQKANLKRIRRHLEKGV